MKKKTFLKIIVIGESGVGKTSLLNKYLTGNTLTDSMATIGANFKKKQLKLRNQDVNLQIWDTAGQEKFQSLG